MIGNTSPGWSRKKSSYRNSLSPRIRTSASCTSGRSSTTNSEAQSGLAITSVANRLKCNRADSGFAACGSRLLKCSIKINDSRSSRSLAFRR